MIIKKIFSKFERVIADKSDIGRVKWLSKNGAKIGENTSLSCSITAFGSEPYLVSIGCNCLISACHFVTHDGGVQTLSEMGFIEPNIDYIAPIKVGNGCFIGMGAYILPGVTIGDHSIIAAGAIVTKDIPENVVAAGVPARPIETIEECYWHKKKTGNFYPTRRLTRKEKRKYFEGIKFSTEDCFQR